MVIAGDMNSSLINNEHINVLKTRELTYLVTNYNIKAVNTQPSCKGPKYTYQSMQTMLDYTFTDELTAKLINNCEILDEGKFSNTSDLLPIVCSLQCQVDSIHVRLENAKWTAWHKADKELTRNIYLIPFKRYLIVK